MYPELVYSIPFFIAALCISVVALFTYRQGRTRGALYLTLLCLCAGFWAACDGLLYLDLKIKTDMFIKCLQYLGIAPLIPLTLIFTLSVFGFEAWVNRTTVLFLIAIAIAVILTVWTNPLHHLVYREYYPIETGPMPMLGLKHGPFWWVILCYHYLLTALMSLILLRTVFTRAGVMRSQAGVVLAAVCVVWGVNAVYVTGNSPVPNMDLGPLGFILVAISMAWGFFRYNLLDVLPIAKAQIFMALSDPILVLDEKDKVLALNPAAEKLLGLKEAEYSGRNMTCLFRKLPQLEELTQTNRSREIILPLNDDERHFELRMSVLGDKKGAQIGRILIFQDITDRKRAHDALRESERLQGALEMAGAVCHDLSQPVMALLGYAELIQRGVSTDDPIYSRTIKMGEQAKRLKETTHRLMRITRYETRQYLGNRIIDIEKSSMM
jgi:PAS domain S-box-containing protein